MTGGDGRARRVYRLLLKAYPRAYRERFGSEMEEGFLALLRMDRRRWGLLGALRCWSGAAVDAAWHGVRARLGGEGALERTDATTWTTKGGDRMRSIISDIRFSIRSLTKRPIFTLTAVATVALAIGANASVFTLVNGLLLRPLPYEDPEELVSIWSAHPGMGWSRTDVNRADAADWRARSEALEDLTIFEPELFNLTGGDAPERISGLRVTPNFLSVLGRAPVRGRDFAPSEIGEGRDDVVILTDGFWERRFARDPRILGRNLTLDGEAVSVIGVMPPDFFVYEGRPDLLRPWSSTPESAPRGHHNAQAIGRLADGASVGLAREELVSISEELATTYEENAGWSVEVYGLHEEALGPVAPTAAKVLMSAALFILLMACVNVANLLLARGSSRQRELEIRTAMGAGRGRIVRQLVTESALLGLAGGALGILAAIWGSRAIVSLLPPTLPPVFRIEMDGTVVAFSLAATVGAILLFGLFPAIRATGGHRGAALRTLRDAGGTGRHRFGAALVVLQSALAVLLLVGGGLLLKSVGQMRGQDFGFDPEHVLTVRVSPPETDYAMGEELAGYWRDVTSAVRRIPGVTAAGTTQSHPLMGSNYGRVVQIEGQDQPDDEGRPVRVTLASPGLFEALDFRLLEGRSFVEADGADAPQVAIVNETFVRRYLPSGSEALGQILRSDGWSGSVVGVVSDVVERSIDEPVGPALYLPMAQNHSRTRSIVLRTQGAPGGVVDAVESAVRSVDADIPVYDVQTMTGLVEERVGGFAVIGQLMGVFAALSLLLGAVGIYGVTAFAASRRTNEIGVRLALGAHRGTVVAMVLREGAKRTGLGLGIGLVLALLMGQALAGLLVGVSPRDPQVFLGVTGILALVSFLGLYLPARRAARVDPVRALTAD